MAVPEDALAEVERFCEKRTPLGVREQMRLACSARGNAITVVERRAPWNVARQREQAGSGAAAWNAGAMSMPEEHDDWFDESAVAFQTSGERTPMLRLIEQFATAPSVAEDPLTRLWRDADDSRRSGADAVEALRERRRQEAIRKPKRTWRRG